MPKRRKTNIISLNSIQALFNWQTLKGGEKHELSLDAKNKFRDYMESLMTRLTELSLEKSNEYVRVTEFHVKDAIEIFEKEFFLKHLDFDELRGINMGLDSLQGKIKNLIESNEGKSQSLADTEIQKSDHGLENPKQEK